MRELVKEEKRMERYAIIIRPNEEMALLHCYPGDSLDLKTLQEIVEGILKRCPRRWRANGAMSRV